MPVSPLQLEPALVWVISAVLVEAAIIDGWKLKVPNWLTFNFMGAGVLYWAISHGWEGLAFASLGVLTGLILYPLCSIGGMGAGDVKLLMGIGAWTGSKVTFLSFCVCAIVGGAIAVVMLLREGQFAKRYVNMQIILGEEIGPFFRLLFSGRFAELGPHFEAMRARAKERKLADLKDGMLLPYGIPMTIGALGYFAYQGWYLAGA